MAISVALIEDSRDIVAAIEKTLSDLGLFAVVSRLATEAEATEWLERNPTSWHVAVVDLVLREGSGFNVVKRYREANPSARVLVLSEYATLPIKLCCVEFGADAVFTKGEFKAFAAYIAALKPRPGQVFN